MDVKCGICLSAQREPFLLDCYHTVCAPCLEESIQNKQCFTCPLCGTYHLLPKNGVAMLKPYPGIEGKINAVSLEADDRCEMCETEREIFSTCIDCNENMCLNCHDYHMKHVKFKLHKTKLKEMTSEVKQRIRSLAINNKCDLHSTELTLFCKSCNRAICNDCTVDKHKLHKIEPLKSSAQKRRDFLLSAIGALKSKIIATETEIDASKFEEISYNKLCEQGMADVHEHAQRSKSIVCNMIDELATINHQKIEKMQNEDVKRIKNYQNELEREKLSLKCLLKSTEDIIKLCSDDSLLNKYTYLYNNLQSFIELRKVKPFICGPQLYSGYIEHDVVKTFFGSVKRNKATKIINPLDSHVYFLREMGDATLKKIESFATSDITRTIFNFCQCVFNSNVYTSSPSLCGTSFNQRCWIVCDKIDRPSGNRSRAEIIGQYALVDASTGVTAHKTFIVNIYTHQILEATEDELLIKCNDSIKKVHLNNTENPTIVDLPAEIGSNICCITEDRSAIYYAPDCKSFREVKIPEDVPTRPNETTKTIPVKQELLDLICVQPSFMSKISCIMETPTKQIMITCDDKVITVNRQFEIQNCYQSEGSSFKGICADPYGRMFVTDRKKSRVIVLSSFGEFKYEICSKEISKPVLITRDSCGNLWIYDKSKRIQVFSYL